MCRGRTRSRALSLLSVNSGFSKGPTSLESPKAEPTIFASNSFKNHMACGSFVPNTPAAAVLRTFLPTLVPQMRGHSRFTSQFEKEPESPESLESPSSPSSPVPYITRTLPLSSDSRSPSPVHTHPALPRVRRSSRPRTRSEIHPNDLHPILASLEQRSKFCVKKGTCATCKRIGSGFPQCGKCGDSWCSRECRLNGSRKHVCRSRLT
ncbi:hypothetical protein AN958_07710 [Leucoagaricus sp. SymC.cos]|nr:hypothetical protein AN958_07710 [Leucoagaricus sp. SymC.cos]